jgi:mono/diheme cytochrome c family protein
MNLRHAIILAVMTILLAACNMTLAADVTPPPGYVSPTPMPTLGPLYPPSAPDIQNGATIYAEKCAPCHGATGLGDGEQGKQLPVTVAAFALPETARKASPAQWFTTVTQGNLDRFMPPFTSLNEQQRWDVVSYALTLHTTAEEIEKGKNILKANCSDCADKFKDQEKMASLSETDLVDLIKSGDGDIPAFGSNLSDEDAYAVAAYLRTLTFGTVGVAQAASTTAPVTPSLEATSETPASTDAGTPSVEVTPLEGTTEPQVTVEATSIAGFGTVSGVIDNQTGAALPSNMKVTLRGYDHGTDPSAGPQEVITLDGNVEADGVYKFENVDMPENRIFISEVVMGSITYKSEFAVVTGGTTEVLLSDIVLHATTDDYSSLSIDNLQMFFDYANADTVQVFSVYSIMNTSEKTILVEMGDKQEVPFITFPAGAEGQGYEATQDSAPFVQTDTGFAMPPSQVSYGLVAFASFPKDTRIDFEQPVSLSVSNTLIFLPEGVTAKGETLTDAGIQALQGTNFQVYHAGPLNAGDSLSFTLSGKPKATSTTTDLTQNQPLLIGAGAFGLVLILAGVWMYLRDRNRLEEEAEEEDDEFEDQESILDAIIALDDLHRAGKLSDEAYHRRRDELKAKLKEES